MQGPKSGITLAAICLALLPVAINASGQTPARQGTTETLKIGAQAPDFTLLAWDGAGPPKPVSLRDFRGKKNVALAFFVFAFTGG